LIDAVCWPRKSSDYSGPMTPSELLSELRVKAKKRHGQHFGNIHRIYGRETGLVSRRGTNRYRYAPNDHLLRSLVLCNVEDHIELREFLDRLWNRYSLVIGPDEASKLSNDAAPDIDRKAFELNANRLEQRLSSIGLLKRLSDGCAYVMTPYRNEANGE